MSIADTSYCILPLIVRSGPAYAGMNRDEFFDFCQANSELRIERTADGDLSIMTPTGGETGSKNADLISQLTVWSFKDGTGLAFDSSTGFWLDNGAMRSPDAAWVGRERWNALTPQERKKFVPIAPDFVLELRSESERSSDLRKKMREYVENGVKLAWLIDPVTRQVEIYRPGQEVIEQGAPATLSGEPELSGFVMDFARIW
jgi:Uma2 family endonuclease